MLKLAISKSAERFLASLDAKQYRQVGQSIFNLLSNPMPHDSSPLKGATNGDRRVDVGKYRIIYVLAGDTLEVLVIGKRNGDEVYKIWERMK